MLNYTPDEPSKLIANTSATLSVKNGIVSLLIVASVLVGLRLQMQVTNHDTRMSFAFGLKKFVDTGITVAIIAKSAVKAEGNMGTTPFTFQVYRPNPGVPGGPGGNNNGHNGSVTLTYNVSGSGGFPANSADFSGGIFASGMVTLINIKDTQLVTINVQGDLLFEPNENFIVKLSNPVSVRDVFIRSTDSSALGSILNDDVCLPISTAYVDSAATGANNGTSWANAYTSLQDALLGCKVDTIKVAQGTYYPDTSVYYALSNNDRTLSFSIPDSTVLLGGYGQGPDTLIRNWQCNKTILCGDIDQDGTLSNNSYHVVTTINVNEQTVVDGFCITGGNANGSSVPANFGGGWYNNGSGTGNRSNPNLLNLVISGNSASQGGAMFNEGTGGKSSPTLTNVLIIGNTAGDDGGAMFNEGTGGISSPILTNVVISGNSAGDAGGGMVNIGYFGNSSPLLTNVVINGNKASYGGGMFNFGFQGNCIPVVTNSILWNNTATVDGPLFANDGGGPIVSYSIIQGTSNNINDPSITSLGGTTDAGSNKFQADGVNPKFINAPLAASAPTSAGNFHVLSSSPAIDMGLNDSVHVATDLDGKMRIINGIVDIGVYEYNLRCIDTFYIDEVGAQIAIPVDSFLLAALLAGYELQVDGVVIDSLRFDCDDLGLNTSLLEVIRTCDGKVTDSCTLRLYVLDTIKPSFTYLPNDTTVSCMDSIPSLATPIAMDNCGSPQVSLVKDTVIDSTCFNRKTLLHIWVAVDASENMVRDTQRIFILDETAPVLACPDTIKVDCFADIPVPDSSLVTATDNCGGHVRIHFEQDSVSTADQILCVNQRILYRVYTGLDTCDNKGQCVQLISVKDTIKPMITCPDPDTVICRTDLPAIDISRVVATDNCSEASMAGIQVFKAVLSGPNESPSNASAGTGTATVTVNNTLKTMRVQVTFSGLTGTTTASHIHATTGIAFTGTAGVATTFTGFPTGVTSGTYDITFDMTLASSYSAPFVTANGGTTTGAYAALLAALQAGKSYLNIHSSTFPGGEIRGFMMDGPVVAWVKDSIPASDSTCVNQLTVYRVYSATDECLNVSYCTQKILVKDTIGPVFTVFPTDTTVICVDEVPPVAGSLGCLHCPFQDVAPFATDNCGSALVSFTEEVSTDSTCQNKKTILRIWTATDACNNMTRDTQMIRVNDTVPPILTCRDTLRFECLIDFPVAYANVDSLLADQGTVLDNCCLDSSSFRLISETMTAPDGMTTLTRMYSIDDCCGNSDTCVQVLQMPICFLDLALKKEIDAPTPYFASPGGTVPFKITIYNQFAIASDSIKIIDYLPSQASSVISPNWVNNNDGTACLTLSRANGLLPGSGLVFGDSVVVSFTVQLGMDIAIASTQNIAEIYSAQDTFHNTLPDLDSSPNGIPDDETGTVDNEINNDGTLDEDDQDPAPFFILRDPVCQDQLNVSLDGNCQKCITAADLLLGPTLPEENYEIQVFDASGRKLQGNCIDISYLGYSLTYKVILNVPGHLNACWGNLKVEDKAPPALRCANDTVSCFEFANLPLVATNIDNCSGDTVRILSEKWVDYGCDSAYLGYVDRTIWGSDRWQNSLTCTSRIYIKKTSLEQVQCPDALEFPCTILHQIGGVKELKIPISIDKNKLTPEFLLSLQQATWEFKDGSKDRVFLTSIPVVPHVKGQSVYLAASGVCKINASYTDKPLPICGTGVKIRREWLIFDWCTQAEKTCVQYISIEDKIAPIPTNQNLGMVASGPHDCGQYINLPKLDYKDCNDVVQTYSLSINEEGIPRILQGDLPASHIWLPVGSFNIIVRLVDACYNESFGAIAVKVEDVTPPTPVCIEYTQVTVDPAGCWASVAAKDLDKGSRDNCSSKLHFAAAQMDSIDYWTKYWTSKLEEKCGKDEYWRNNELYQTWIDDWIDCYIFRDTVYFDECGSNQVVLRVYEADRIPLRDPHIFPWSEHAWYCYNSNIFYRIAHNYNFFDSKGSKLASWRLPLDCKSIVEDWINTQKTKYISSRYGHNIDVSAVTINQTMDSIQSQGTYCPGDTSINLNPGECNRIVKYSIALPLGYTAVQTSGLPSGSQFPIGTTTNGFNIYDGNTLVTNCTFSVTIKEFDLSPAVSKQMDSIYTHGTYCPGDTTINLNPGECGRIVKYSIILPPGYSAVQTSGLASGYEFPIGTTTNRFNINDGNTLVTNCEFSVTIKEFDMPSNYIYCKENTTIILNNGSAILGAGQVLVNANYGCFDNYIVELFKSGYVPAVLSTQDIGQMYVYRVIDPRTSQKCEGKVLIGTPPLNCKAISTVLLNNDGFAFLGAGQVLIEEQYRCFDNYIVEFLKGSYVPGIATTQDVGMTLTYRVIDPTSSAKCEGKVFIDDINNSIEQLNFLNNRRHSKILYNDCMVTVLVDDKQAPVVNHLQDITIYCDGAPEYAGHPACEHSERFSKWPLDLKDSKGVWHGYYGGSDFLGVHIDADAHDDPDACEFNKGWAPIYCRSWLYLDSFDQAGHVNPKDYFSTLVKVDKKRPLDHVLKSNEFTITDNCRLEDTTLRIVDNGTLNGCSEGWIQRTWTIKDKCGNSVTAIQKIIVKHRSDFEVIFPEDKVVTCDFLNKTDTSTAGAGAPIISDDECEQVGVRYADEIFTVEDGACYKIVRTWTLVDWCIYDPNQHNHYPDVIVDDRLRANTSNRSCVYRNIKDNNDGYMTYVQIIKVIDETPPVVTTRDTTVCVYSDNCLVSVVIPLSASDNCAAASDIRFRYFIDLNATDAVYNGKLFDPTSIDQGGTQYVKDFVFLLGAPGRHVVHVVGIDNCGNADTSSFRFEIKDCKKPTPYCYNGIATVIMPGNGQVTVWAKDLNLNSSDNCTPAADLKYSFSADVATASRQFTCADMTSDGQNQIFEVEIWVTDKAGNQDLCRTYIKLQDNADAANGRPEGACKDTVASLASISGKLLTEDQQGVESATVQIKSATPSGIPAWKSSIDGSYQFNAIPTSGSYSISAMRDDNPMNGVSTLDLVLIQKHILGTEPFTSPYKIIASDADNDQNVSAIDLIELRKLILGIYDKLPNNTSWKFEPKSYQFDDILNPWSAPGEEQIIVAQGAMVKDFVGIKIGDVNATAAAHSLMNTEVRGSGSGLILEVKDRTFKAGERVEVSFTSPNFKGVSGFQGTMSIGNKQLAIDKIEPGSLHVSENNFGRRWENEGLITMSWNGNQSQDLDDQAVLFTMNFTAQRDGRLSEVLRIGSQHTIAESYEGKGELGNVSIRFIGQHGQEVTAQSELYQNYPNPFDQRTVIGFNLAELGRGTLRITDITGRTIKSIEKEWAKGYQEVWIDRREIKASGVLYYSFESKAFKATKKMVLLD